ncbi:chromosome segregation ATPase [Vibrio sp. JCM 19053]|nr:chromosome segregation ATPase [Vibrio sp. JCM 19053]
MDKGALTALIIFFLPLLLLVISWMRGKKNKKAYEEKLADSNKQLEYVYGKVARLEEERRDLKTKYGPIIDIEGHAAKLLDEAEEDAASKRDQSLKLLAEAEANADEIRQEAKSLRSEATQRLKDSKEKAELIKSEARVEAEKVISFAETQAKEIAGDAYEAKAKADSYDKAIRAMRNTIEGYKDDYIIRTTLC